jgi:hypothetical protein
MCGRLWIILLCGDPHLKGPGSPEIPALPTLVPLAGFLPCGVATRTGVLMHGHMWWNGHADTHACIFLAVP